VADSISFFLFCPADSRRDAKDSVISGGAGALMRRRRQGIPTVAFSAAGAASGPAWAAPDAAGTSPGPAGSEVKA
jgi:hypothetical protein